MNSLSPLTGKPLSTPRPRNSSPSSSATPPTNTPEPEEKVDLSLAIGNAVRRSAGTAASILAAPYNVISALVTPSITSDASESSRSTTTMIGHLNTNMVMAGLAGATLGLPAGLGGALLLGVTSAATAGMWTGVGLLFKGEGDPAISRLAEAKGRAEERSEGSPGTAYGLSLSAGLKHRFSHSYQKGVSAADSLLVHTGNISDAVVAFGKDIRDQPT